MDLPGPKNTYTHSIHCNNKGYIVWVSMEHHCTNTESCFRDKYIIKTNTAGDSVAGPVEGHASSQYHFLQQTLVFDVRTKYFPPTIDLGLLYDVISIWKLLHPFSRATSIKGNGPSPVTVIIL